MGSHGRRGKIISLNGTSSSGKSSIAGQLPLMLDLPHRPPGVALAQQAEVYRLRSLLLDQEKDRAGAAQERTAREGAVAVMR
jgi:uridine kinase